MGLIFKLGLGLEMEPSGSAILTLSVTPPRSLLAVAMAIGAS